MIHRLGYKYASSLTTVQSSESESQIRVHYRKKKMVKQFSGNDGEGRPSFGSTISFLSSADGSESDTSVLSSSSSSSPERTSFSRDIPQILSPSTHITDNLLSLDYDPPTDYSSSESNMSSSSAERASFSHDIPQILSPSTHITDNLLSLDYDPPTDYSSSESNMSSSSAERASFSHDIPPSPSTYTDKFTYYHPPTDYSSSESDRSTSLSSAGGASLSMNDISDLPQLLSPLSDYAMSNSEGSVYSHSFEDCKLNDSSVCTNSDLAIPVNLSSTLNDTAANSSTLGIDSSMYSTEKVRIKVYLHITSLSASMRVWNPFSPSTVPSPLTQC